MAGRADIPVVAGAGYSSTTGRPIGGLPDHRRFWGTTRLPPPRPSQPHEALDLLDSSIDRGATVVAIGPYTNLANLEAARPGRLEQARVVVMGGWLNRLGDDFPPWGPSRDWNVVCDLDAAETVATRCGELTWSTIPGAHHRGPPAPAGPAEAARVGPARPAPRPALARAQRREPDPRDGRPVAGPGRRPGQLPLGSGRLCRRTRLGRVVGFRVSGGGCRPRSGGAARSAWFRRRKVGVPGWSCMWMLTPSRSAGSPRWSPPPRPLPLIPSPSSPIRGRGRGR